MTRRIAARLAILLTLLVGMLGCELSPPLQPLAESPSPGASTKPSQAVSTPTPTSATPTPAPTPAVRGIRGYVVDRNGLRLPGAQVAVGAFTGTTAEASASATDEKGQAITLEAGEFLLLGTPAGSQSLFVAYDGVSRSQPVMVAATGLSQVGKVVLPVEGAVPEGSTALVVATTTSMIEVQKASSSAPLVFSPDRLIVQLKAPPNGAGETIGAYAFTYVHAGDATISPTIVWEVPPVLVLPAAGPTTSGPAVDLSAMIRNTSSSLQSGWTFDDPAATLKLEFRRSASGPPVLDRDGKPLVLRVNCLLVP